MSFHRYRLFPVFALIVFLLCLSACNLQDAPATVFVIVTPTQEPVQDGAPVADPASVTLPEVQLVAQSTLQPVPTAAPTAPPVPNVFEDQLDPALLLASFYNAVNLRDYARAYGYWESPPQNASLTQFAQGYADTASVSGVVHLPLPTGAAAGSSYATLKTALISTQTDGSQQVFSACYVARKSNVPVGDAPTPDPNWRLYDGQAIAVAGPVTPLLIDEACSGTPYVDEPTVDVLNNQATPITLLGSYYNAINVRDYGRAYGYWETPPGNASLEQFARGYAETTHVGVFVGLDIQGGGAAGSVYMEIPALLIATQTDGSEQVYAGCYVTRRSNVPAGDSPTPDPNWRLYSASVARVDDFSTGLARLAQRCIA